VAQGLSHAQDMMNVKPKVTFTVRQKNFCWKGTREDSAYQYNVWRTYHKIPQYLKKKHERKRRKRRSSKSI
jgi:hypothetical protein